MIRLYQYYGSTCGTTGFGGIAARGSRGKSAEDKDSGVRHCAIAYTLFSRWNAHRGVESPHSMGFPLSAAESLLRVFSRVGETDPAQGVKFLVGSLLRISQPDHSHVEMEILRSRLTPYFRSGDGNSMDAAHAALPRHFLTTRGTHSWYRHRSECRIDGICPNEMAWIRSRFDLPDLESHCSLAYCTDSQRTKKLMKTIDQGAPHQLKLAAILEEIFIW
jgi:hypothetical protein